MTAHSAGSERAAGPPAPAGVSAGASTGSPELAKPVGAYRGAPRVREKAVLYAYRGAAWALWRIPPRLSWTVGGALAQGVYLAWPAKRRWVRANCARVLGVPASDPATGRLGRRLYGTYARYVVELMRLPNVPREAAANLVVLTWEEWARRMIDDPRGIILVSAHIGNNEALVAGLGSRGWPLSALADDSTYGELFALLERQRAAMGIRMVRWRNIREVFGILRRGEVLALLVDWGYRPDGIPVRLFGDWTTLPAGPAVLAARTGAIIVPVWGHRQADGRILFQRAEPFTVPSDAPADLLAATQRIADAIEAAVRGAPEQWHTFKPVWPDTEAEAARLAAQAEAMLQATADGPSGARSVARAARRATEDSARAGGSPGPEWAVSWPADGAGG